MPEMQPATVRGNRAARTDDDGGVHVLRVRLGGRVSLGDPRLFNYVIMALYFLNACRWALEGKYADMCYWLSALAITLTVTFGYSH